MNDPIIDFKALTKTYDYYTAVDRLTLQIGKGEIFGLLGPNGAGKTTTILMMLGLAEPTSGSVTVCGLNPTRQPLDVKTTVGYLPDDVGFYEDRTGFENLVYTARLNRLKPSVARERAEQLLQRVGLTEAAGKKVSAYSRGMRQRLGLADVLIKNPQVIILDEPTLGIDPEGVREFLELLRKLSRDEGLTVLLSSHHLHQVQQVCDRVGLFVKGKLIAAGDVPALSRELFAEESLGVELEPTAVSEELIEAIRAVEGVQYVRRDGEKLTIGCREDVTPAIARAVFDAGLSIRSMAQKEFGLDEIYHRYFEGGKARDRHKQATKPA